MKKILISMLFIAISSTSLLADRATANANAIITAIYLEGYGYTIQDISGRHLRTNHYRTYNRYLYSGTCYAIASIGDDDVRDLDIQVWDRNWNYITSDSDSSKTAVVEVCPRYSGTYRFRTRMYSGSGYFRMIMGWK